MTKKDFEALARVCKTIKPKAERRRVAREIAYYCTDANPRFDLLRFLQAADAE